MQIEEFRWRLQSLFENLELNYSDANKGAWTNHVEEEDMTITEIAQEECTSILAGASLARLGCSFGDQPYVVPIYYAYEAGYLYVLSTLGQKIEWMRRNPKVCVEIDEIISETKWMTVVLKGTYQELAEPQFTEERKRARKLLDQRARWWQTALAERQSKSEDQLIAPVFFRIRIDSVSGLQASEKA